MCESYKYESNIKSEREEKKKKIFFTIFKADNNKVTQRLL